MMRRVLGLISITVFTSILNAQSAGGAIRGTVTDANNRVVANAQVAATNQDTNAETDATTDSSGRFSFANLPAGTYTVDAAAPGLDGEVDDVAVNEGEAGNISIRLEAAEGDDAGAGNQDAGPVPARSPQATAQASANAPAHQGNANASAQAGQPAPAGMIYLGAPALSPEEMNAVMTWIAAQVAAINLPYCYRQSYGNGAGEPYTCHDGYERNGLLCYTKCRDGFAGNGPVCWGVCPAGSNDIGAFCQKGYAQKSAGGGCPAGFRLVTGRGSSGCAQACPEGWSDTGTGCTKPSYGRGAGIPLADGLCAPGLQKDPSGALCYPPCKADFHMVGPVCWQNCPSQQPFDCGVGCSTNQKECASGTVNMVLTPIELAASLIPYAGEAAGAAHGVTEATEAGVHAAEIGVDASRIARAAAQLKDAYAAVKDSLNAVKGNIVEAVGGEDNMAKIMQVKKAAGKVYVIANDTNKQIDIYSREYADNFEKLTSPAIAAEIDQRFGPVGAYQVKREWGVRHLLLTLNSDGFATATNEISVLSTADFTGVLSVVSAYMKPVCANNAVLPVVHPLYGN